MAAGVLDLYRHGCSNQHMIKLKLHFNIAVCTKI